MYAAMDVHRISSLKNVFSYYTNSVTCVRCIPCVCVCVYNGCAGLRTWTRRVWLRRTALQKKMDKKKIVAVPD